MQQEPYAEGRSVEASDRFECERGRHEDPGSKRTLLLEGKVYGAGGEGRERKLSIESGALEKRHPQEETYQQSSEAGVPRAGRGESQSVRQNHDQDSYESG